jgi:hypothetical protein
VDKVIREEEDDTLQEARQLIVLELKMEIEKYIKRIEESRIPVTDDWTDGVNNGLEWAVRILKKDKSAS